MPKFLTKIMASLRCGSANDVALPQQVQPTSFIGGQMQDPTETAAATLRRQSQRNQVRLSGRGQFKDVSHHIVDGKDFAIAREKANKGRLSKELDMLRQLGEAGLNVPKVFGSTNQTDPRTALFKTGKLPTVIMEWLDGTTFDLKDRDPYPSKLKLLASFSGLELDQKKLSSEAAPFYMGALETQLGAQHQSGELAKQLGSEATQQRMQTLKSGLSQIRAYMDNTSIVDLQFILQLATGKPIVFDPAALKKPSELNDQQLNDRNGLLEWLDGAMNYVDDLLHGTIADPMDDLFEEWRTEPLEQAATT